MLLDGAQRVTLYQLPAASGVRYSNGTMELRGKGTELQLIRDGVVTPLKDCEPYAIMPREQRAIHRLDAARGRPVSATREQRRRVARRGARKNQDPTVARAGEARDVPARCKKVRLGLGKRQTVQPNAPAVFSQKQ